MNERAEMERELFFSGPMLVLVWILLFARLWILQCCVIRLVMVGYGEKSNRRERFLFPFVTSFVLTALLWARVCWMPAPFLENRAVYLLFTCVNPLFSIAYCLIGIKSFRLPLMRTIHLMATAYICMTLVCVIEKLISPIFFVPGKTLVAVIVPALEGVYWLVFVLLFLAVRSFVRRHIHTSENLEGMYSKVKREAAWYLLKAAMMYLLLFLPSASPKTTLTYLVVATLLLFWFLISLMLDYHSTLCKLEMDKEIHIQALHMSIGEFRELKHDFYNILQAYEGYLALDDMDELKRYHNSLFHETLCVGNVVHLGVRMRENPAFISMLIKKYHQAERQAIQLFFSVQCPNFDLIAPNETAICIVEALLDHALFTALKMDRKHVHFTIAKKPGGDILIIVTNRTIDRLSPMGEDHVSYYNDIRRLIEKHDNINVRFSFMNNELSAYLEIKRAENAAQLGRKGRLDHDF